MGRIFTSHGVAAGVDARWFAYRNYVETQKWARFLAEARRFVPLAKALSGRGNALTIDDATRGAADAALLAIAHGHAVTLFVNSGPVEGGRPHWFHVLNLMVDGLSEQPIDFEGTAFPMVTFKERRKLRERVKERVCSLKEEAARVGLLAGLAEQWGVGALSFPEHLRTLNQAELEALRSAGVELQNHGRWHAQHGCLSPEESAREVREGRDWLRDALGVEAGCFAVPFGDALPSSEALAACTVWLTVSDQWPYRRLSPQVVNRRELSLPSDAPRLRTLRARVRRIFSR